MKKYDQYYSKAKELINEVINYKHYTQFKLSQSDHGWTVIGKGKGDKAWKDMFPSNWFSKSQATKELEKIKKEYKASKNINEAFPQFIEKDTYKNDYPKVYKFIKDLSDYNMEENKILMNVKEMMMNRDAESSIMSYLKKKHEEAEI